jgi:TPR repeat protein
MYFNGKGVAQDYAEAVKWFRKAAEQGDAFAQARLGAMYILGQGVPQDYVMAHMFLNLAAASLTDPAMQSSTAALRKTVAAKMTPEQIAEAQKLARE